MPAYHGKNGMVYISTTSTGAVALLSGATEWTLNMQTDKEEVTAFGDTNKTYVQGLPDISGTINGVWRDDETKWMAARASSDGCKIILYPSNLATTKYAVGLAWFDCSISSSVGGRIEMSGSFVAAASWTILL